MRKNPNLKEIQHLLEELIIPFYEVERDMAIPTNKRRLENDAEHSWSVALLACSLAPLIDEKLDVGKIAQFSLIHDLPEVFAGDTSVWGEKESLASKTVREKAAREKLSTQFSAFPWISETTDSYERKDSDEANFVWAVDKLIALFMRHLDRGKFYIQEKITKERFDRDMSIHRKKAHAHPKVAEYYEELRALVDAHPEYFYRDK